MLVYPENRLLSVLPGILWGFSACFSRYTFQARGAKRGLWGCKEGVQRIEGQPGVCKTDVKWWPRPELNWDLTIRNRRLYPFELRDQTVRNLAGSVGGASPEVDHGNAISITGCSGSGSTSRVTKSQVSRAGVRAIMAGICDFPLPPRQES